MERSDEELVAQCKAGCMDAFEPLFHRYEHRVFNVVARTIGNRDDAEDLKQEVFFRAYKSLGSFRGGCKFSTWLFRIAVNLCLDSIKKKRITTSSVDELFEEQSWSALNSLASEDPSVTAERNELKRAVQEAILSLPPHYRSLIVLRHIEGLSYDEVAAVVGCSVNALNVRLHRARLALRERMKPYVLSGLGEQRDEMQKGEIKDSPTVSETA